ncbi:MAG: DUF5682 family protein [Actinomycetota bacterium]
MHPSIADPQSRVVFVPVRHHSPACARVVRRLAEAIRPDAILIEGPSDFNARMEELTLPHQLPIAVYTYVRFPDGARRGAYYPFCVYSPEWQAILAAKELGVPARFIDLPWRNMAEPDAPTHRYADGELRFSDYVDALCRSVGVDDFDTLWDTLFEIEGEPAVADFLQRCHRFCWQARELDSHVPALDLQREAYMAEQIRQALTEFPGRLLVVTGGFHSHALFERVHLAEGEAKSETLREEPPVDTGGEAECGIALTPYSYERLDSLTGYESGMPNPGFYHRVWLDRENGRRNSHRRLLAEVVKALRKRGQQFSTADLIAVETTAQGLATIRCHDEVWRSDLVDGILGALVKDELELGMPHPFLEAIHEVFRGGERGRLADGAQLPPLVHDLRRVLQEHLLEPEPRERMVDLELTSSSDLERSRALHRVAALQIAGFDQVAGTDLVTRADLSRICERWRIRWSPEFESGCIESALYGPTLEEAAAARLQERAEGLERNADLAARLLLDARLMGLPELDAEFQGRLVELVRQDGDFFTVTGALGHLLHLYRYDDILGSPGASDVGKLLAEAWVRGLWLLESLGDPQGKEREFLRGLQSLIRTLEACGAELDLDRADLVNVLHRSSGDNSHSPLLRGAATGALWTLGEASRETVLEGMRYCADPSRLGDYLTGLFSLARETAQRHEDLVVSIDELLAAYSDEQFLEALPSLRLAFSFFTPREKHYMASTLLRALGLADAPTLPALEVGPEMAARAFELEARVMETVERYGLRGGKERPQ